jgi:hypothetical protein
MEWASAMGVVRIPLYRRPPSPGLGSLRLDQLLFARACLPIDLECSTYQVVETPSETFLPVEALLAALYESHEVSRSILKVLAEVGSVVPLHSHVRLAITTKGLLVPHAEAAGFHLTKVVREGDQSYAEIEWQAAGQSNRFHCCICRFSLERRGLRDEGAWLPAGIIGVASLLAREFHQLVPGSPDTVFSPTGRSLIQSSHPAQHG